ncbi:MAG: hypothetical protein GYB68_09020 [Chloroflexi bacterium]|nr:hypothetical protein [Chloroflexota bacterium]
MRRFLLLVSLLALALIPAAQPVHAAPPELGVNLIGNGAFDTLPGNDDWTAVLSGSGPQGFFEDSRAYSAPAAFVLDGDNAAETIQQRVDGIDGQPGDTYMLTFYLAGLNVADGGQIGALIRLRSGDTLEQNIPCLVEQSGSFQWQQITCEINVTAQIDSVEVWIGWQGVSSGQLGIDDVVLELFGPREANCPVFPGDNPWNTPVTDLPVHPNSANFIAAISASRDFLHPDFGGDQAQYGIPFIVVPGTEPLVPITFTAFGDESDPGPYPIPENAPVEGGSDRHVIAVDGDNCMLYELFNAEWNGTGWNADSGATFNLRSNALRPEGWTSADAAGLPIYPGLARYDEVAAGEINHALRFTVQQSQRAYIYPALHFASSSADPNLPPMGLRVRLRADYDLSGFTGQSRVILEALKEYGMIVADNGSSWFISGANSPNWDDDDLNQIKTVPASAFEAVYTGETITP